jgi:hypothetical protein
VRTILLVGLLSLCSAASTQQSSEVKQSLQYSCIHDEFFLGVSVSLPEHDRFPAVRLTLSDPAERQIGFRAGRQQIPKSGYGRIVEISTLPNRSRAVAIEVCGAMQGVYMLTVDEQEAAHYRLSVRGTGAQTSNIQVFNFVSKSGGRRQYRFRYISTEGNSRIEWLDDSGQQLSILQLSAIDEW